jgi:hypothetical protein
LRERRIPLRAVPDAWDAWWEGDGIALRQLPTTFGEAHVRAQRGRASASVELALAGPSPERVTVRFPGVKYARADGKSCAISGAIIVAPNFARLEIEFPRIDPTPAHICLWRPRDQLRPLWRNLSIPPSSPIRRIGHVRRCTSTSRRVVWGCWLRRAQCQSRSSQGVTMATGANSAKVGIHTISGFCGNDPGDLKWPGDKLDSRIAPETCGPLSPQKSIRKQALAAHSSPRRTVQRFWMAVMMWARIFMARPTANSSDTANVACLPDDG